MLSEIFIVFEQLLVMLLLFYITLIIMILFHLIGVGIYKCFCKLFPGHDQIVPFVQMSMRCLEKYAHGAIVGMHMTIRMWLSVERFASVALCMLLLHLFVVFVGLDHLAPIETATRYGNHVVVRGSYHNTLIGRMWRATQQFEKRMLLYVHCAFFVINYVCLIIFQNVQ